MTRLTIAACIAALVATAGAAVAQERVPITVAGENVAYIRTGGPYGSIYQRQAKIDQRIVQVLSNERDRIFVQEIGGPDLDVYQVDGRWTLSIGNTMIIQAFPEDAYQTTTKALIYQWKENFARQLPLAVSPIHVPQWWRDAHPEEQASFEPKPHGMPDEDLPLVREVAAILQAARDMSDDRFEALLPAMEQALIERVWTYRHPACGAPPITEAIRAKSAIKRARGLSEEQYRAEKWWMAGLTIKILRREMEMTDGVGPIPEQRDLPDLEAPTGPDTGPVAPDVIGPARIASGTPIRRVSIGTGLGRDNSLLNVGQQFDADTSQLLVYLEVNDAPQNTIIGVAIEQQGDTTIARRLVRVSGDRRMAVTFYPARVTTFASGDYSVKLTVNGEDAGVVPFRVGTGAGILIDG